MNGAVAVAPAGPAVRLNRRTLVAFGFVTASAVLLLAMPPGPRAVAAPALTLLNIAIAFLLVLWNRDGVLPVFEVGTVCVAFTALYSAYPLIAFLLADGLWSGASDNRLLQWAPDMRELGEYAWRSVAYLAPLAGLYLAVRGRASAEGVGMRGLSAAGTAVIVWLFLLLLTYFAGLSVWFGVSYAPSYTDVELGRVRAPSDLPLMVRQISHNAWGVLSILKLCGVALLLRRWSSWAARGVLIAWLSLEVVLTTLRMGGRTDTVVLLLATALLYHRLVRPLGVRIVALAGAGLITAALLFGFARDFMRGGSAVDGAAYWSTANEFQVLLSTGYDLHRRRLSGELASVPWQVYAADALRLVPSQLLGVQKIDPAEWYLSHLNVSSSGTGLMFGVMAQAAIGHGAIELFGRGALLGILFALAHRAYVRRARSFWVSMLYLYLCLWSYYTFRASSFYFVYVFVYRFLPTMAVVIAGAAALERAASRGTRVAP